MYHTYSSDQFGGFKMSDSFSSNPQNFGSPLLASSSLQGPGTLAGGSQYLPEYLLGDSSAASPPVNRLWSASFSSSQSPTKNRSFGSHTSPTTTQQLQHQQAQQQQQHQQTQNSIKFGRGPGPKSGGPPTQPLFDQGSPSVLNASRLSYITSPTSNLDSSQVDISRSLLQQSQFSSPAQLDPFYTQGESLKPDDTLDETWVTVFGFPPSAAGYILQQFSLYGTILEHTISNMGNWMHIHYQSRIQARKAIGKHGKIFGGTIMIGVTPCIDKDVMSESLKENIPMSVGEQGGEERNASRKSTIRPLTQAYKAAISEHEVIPMNRTPQKKNSVVTKAMEYVFGW